jgi:predicted PurR-regulated permease PerM
MPEEKLEHSDESLTPEQRRDWSKNIFNFANLAIIAILIGLLIFLVRIRGILGIFLAATVLSVLLTPAVHFFEKRRVPKIVAILIVYIIVFGILITSISLLVPVAIQQGLDIADAYPEYRAKVLEFWDDVRVRLDVLGMTDNVTDIFDYSTPERQQAMATTLQRALSQGWSIILGSASVITTLISIPVIAFYLLKDGPVIRKTLMGLIPESWHTSTTGLLGTLSGSVYGYVKGQLLLCLVMFLITWPVLAILGVPYALLLAVLAGLMEFIPIIGPTIALIPAFLIAVFFDFDPATSKGLIVGLSPIWRGGVVILTYIGIQLSESNLLVPRIMGHTMDIHPLAVIFALLCGAVLAGIWGMLLALPVAAAAKVFYQYFYPSFIERIDKLLSFE